MKCPHCDTPIDEHEASRCLDAWVVQAVFGLRIEPGDDIFWVREEDESYGHPLLYYSIDIAAAWEIIEMLRQKHILLPLWSLATLEFFPLAICRAALKAIREPQTA